MGQYADPVFKKQYLRGYVFGMNPIFHDCENPRRIVPPIHDDAFLLGFDEGRLCYEKLNGPLCNGIPERVITDKLVREMYIDGNLGYPIDLLGFSTPQQRVLLEAYNDGAANMDPMHKILLQDLLVSLGI